MTAELPQIHPQRYSKRLAIVVPYRDRHEHLVKFAPHIAAYFERDKLDRFIPVTINIIEQYGDGPFNRGMLKNCGFVLTQPDSDYICFHDVDYLPLWADYSWSPRPARLIWYGLTLREDWGSFFGGVVLFDNPVFRRCNGFPNCYWGWGPEDFELGCRCGLVGMPFDKRDGTYISLPHKHAGFQAPGIWSEEARQTHAIFDTRKHDLSRAMRDDGLSSLSFRLVDKKSLVAGSRPIPNGWHWVVELSGP